MIEESSDQFVEFGIWPRGPLPIWPVEQYPDFGDFPQENYVPLINEAVGVRSILSVGIPFDVDKEVDAVLGLVRGILRKNGTVSLTLLDHPETVRRATLGG